MKRINFMVASTAGQALIKHKWNSARDAGVAMVREIARTSGEQYELVDEQIVKEDKYTFLSGTFVWQGARSGNKVVITITRMP